jgi:hypothetical protein
MALAPSRFTVMRASGQVSAQGHGLTARPLVGFGKGAFQQHLREALARLKHDPEKWNPVFGKDHASS